VVENLRQLLARLLVDARHAPESAALEFVRWYVPAKFQLLYRDGGGDPPQELPKRLSAVLADEPAFLDSLRSAAAQRRGNNVPPKHAYCLRTWMAALVADCVDHLTSSLLHSTWWHEDVRDQSPLLNLKNKDGRDLLPLARDTVGCSNALLATPALEGKLVESWQTDSWRWQTGNASTSGQHHRSMSELLHGLEESQCMVEDVHWTLACGLSLLLEAQGELEQPVIQQKMAFAAALAEDAALRLMLCDGCRYDGWGINAVALDKIFWILGFLRFALPNANLCTNGSRMQAAYTNAIAQFDKHPIVWWRGDLDQQMLYGRPQLCPVAKPSLCVSGGSVVSATEEEQFILPTCQIDHETSDYTVVKKIDAASSNSCAWAASGTVGLFLPFNVGALNSFDHLTGFITWFFPALAWFYGGQRMQRLLRAVWRQGGLPDPAPLLLDVASTEIVFVNYRGNDWFPEVNDPGDTETARQRVKTVSRLVSLWREFFPMLSKVSVRTLDEIESCRCYQSALWGYVDPSLRMHGDINYEVTAGIRTALRSHFVPDISGDTDWRSSLLKYTSHRGFRIRPSASASIMHNGLRRVSVVIAHRKTEIRGPLTRNITNRVALSRALSKLTDSTPGIQLIEGSLEALPLTVQVRLAIDIAEVVIQAFGAGMAWSTMLPAGSYAIELQGDGVGITTFVSCFPPRLGDNPWQPATNPRTEWGAWAFQNRINFACVTRQPTRAHCMRQFFPIAFDTPIIDVDVDLVVKLVQDAALRLRQ